MDRNTILIAAFKVWSGDMYMKTSLSTLASDLGITKPALYRHFKSKEEILESMAEYALSEYSKVSASMRPELESGTFRHAAGIYSRRIMEFYLAHPGFFYFFARLLIQHEHQFHGRVIKLLETDALMFGAILGRDPSLSREDIELIIRLFFTHVTYWCELAVGNSRIEFRGGIDGAVEGLVSSLFDGFFPDADPEEFDPLHVENGISLETSDIPFLDKRLEAVMTVISREGFAKASVRKIAGELNISKSSLYSFFKNKNDMFVSVRERHRSWLENICRVKLISFETELERFYGFLYIIVLSFLQDERKVVFLNWLRFQNIKSEGNSPGFNFQAASVTESVYEKGHIKSYGLEPRHFEGCFRVQLVRDIMEKINRIGGIEKIIPHFRQIFTYMAFGLSKTLNV